MRLHQIRQVNEGGKAIPDASPLTPSEVREVLDIATKILPELEIYPIGSAGYKPQSSDVDVLVDADELMAATGAPDLKKARAELASYLRSKGYQATQSGVSVHVGILLDDKVGQLDIMAVDGAKHVAPLHRHDYRDDPEMKGGSVVIMIADLVKLANPNHKLSPYRGIVDRETDELVTRDKNEIAKMIIGDEATAVDLSSTSAILRALKNHPEKLQALKKDKVTEGGWASTATQSTVLTPPVVKEAMATFKDFIAGFNRWLMSRSEYPVQVGNLVGSTAYVDVDDDETIYGDIDVIVATPELEGKTTPQNAAHYGRLLKQYVLEKPPLAYDVPDPAETNVILQVGDKVIQVDLIWTTESVSRWTQYRMTPERSVKGLIGGKIYSILGDMLSMSIQTHGALMKVKDGEPVSYRLRKDTELITVSTDIENFGLDILKLIFTKTYPDRNKLKVSKELRERPGVDVAEVKVADLVKVVRGLARSFESNDLYGHYNLKEFSSYEDFISQFKTRYRERILRELNAAKYRKAETPGAKAAVKRAHDKIRKGLEMVEKLL